MDVRFRHVVPEPVPLALVLALVFSLSGPSLPAWGQADTTTVARPDTAEPASGDVPSDPARAPTPIHGRPVVDSIPGRSPVTGIEHVLAERPGSFLHDLGAVGWPHGWSPDGLAPHRSSLWIGGRPYDDPVLGRPRFDLLPVSFLAPPQAGVDPGGDGVGVHTSWRTYDRKRPVTEIRFQDDTNGLQAVEVGHSQKRRLDVGGTTGLFTLSFGFGGRATNGAYTSSDLRSERRLWGRLRYQRSDWGVELLDFSSRHRIGTHGGVVPLENEGFDSVFFPSLTENNVRNEGARRRTFRNDLTARAWAPLLPGRDGRTTLSATWTSNTFDFGTGEGQQALGATGDTTLTVVTDGFHANLRQSLSVGRHALTLGARGSWWRVDRTTVPNIDGTRWSTHAFARDSLRLGPTRLVLDAGWHTTIDQQYPSAALHASTPVGSFDLSASLELTGQSSSWIERNGFGRFVTPLPDAPSSRTDRVLRGSVEARTRVGAFDLQLRGFAHQIRGAVDLFAEPATASQHTDSLVVRQTASPVRRVGATGSLGWRRTTDRGLYFTGQATALTTLTDGRSALQARLGETLPTAFGRGRLGARFTLFQDLRTDMYVQGRGWTQMNGRWFHPPTGRLAVPPRDTPVPSAPTRRPGPSWTADVHAELSLRSATLFFSLENVQARTGVQSGTFIVPVFPLPARQFRFGIFWPVFD